MIRQNILNSPSSVRRGNKNKYYTMKLREAGKTALPVCYSSASSALQVLYKPVIMAKEMQVTGFGKSTPDSPTHEGSLHSLLSLVSD